MAGLFENWPNFLHELAGKLGQDLATLLTPHTFILVQTAAESTSCVNVNIYLYFVGNCDYIGTRQTGPPG